MNKIYVLLPLLLSMACSPSRSPSPNLILIIADDLNWDDLGAYGHPYIQSPHIDQLAKEGMLFNQAFLTTSSCSPSRASIITGTYPHQTDAEQLHWPLPQAKITFVEKLREAGYWTGQAGKWHLGDAVKDRFDRIIPEGTGGFVYKEGSQPSFETEADGSGCQHWIDIFNARAKDKPFFLWLAAVDPHRPYHKDIISRPHKAEEVIVPPYLPDRPEVRRELALYYDEVTRLDQYVGSLLKELEDQGERENTLVLFISDNGRAFPRDKTTLYDGGIKTPWIAFWPRTISPGTECASLVSSVDIAKTFLSLAGSKDLGGFEGYDISALFSKPSTHIRDYVFAEDHWHDFEDYGRAVRNTQYKYIKNYLPEIAATPSADVLRDSTYQAMISMYTLNQLNEAQKACFTKPRPEEELYDVQSDPFELNNLAKDNSYQAQLEAFRAALEGFQEKTHDPKTLPYLTPDEFDRSTGKPTAARVRPRLSKQEMIAKGTLEVLDP